MTIDNDNDTAFLMLDAPCSSILSHNTISSREPANRFESWFDLPYDITIPNWSSHIINSTTMAKSRMASSKPPSSSPPPPSSSEMDRSGGSRGTVVVASNHSHSCYSIDVLADAAAERAARRRAGMCEQCGVVQTHTFVLWGRRRKPIQVWCSISYCRMVW